MSLQEQLRTINGVVIPTIAYGVYQVKDAAQCQKAVEDALAVGYRALDTAASYGNEAAVGAAIKASGIKREELFVTTKLWLEDASEDGAKRAVARSLELLGLDYLDAYLIHQPIGDVFGAWRTMTAFHEQGVLRRIGVSNFAPDRLLDFWYHNRIKPMINQIEINPFCQNAEAIKIMGEIGVAPQAWAPLAEGKNGLFTHPVLSAIAQKHQASVAQVVLRYVMALGAGVVVKSVHANRMQENFNSTTVELDADDMAKIKALDTKTSQFFSHRDPAIIRWMCERHLQH
ncbi:MAG TPA: aldo/keto reductase [Candidatus Aphodousia gallistercoris]|nr:aldo/keto reductase [Candidatus Aphodousia gallistercoris]